MPKKYIVFLKSVWRLWFVALIIVILIVFVYNQVAAIIIAIISVALLLLSYVPLLFSKKRLGRRLKKYPRVEDVELAKNLGKSVSKIQDKLFKFSQNQEKKESLVIYINKHYIYYNESTVEEYLELYKQGYSEKEILDELKTVKMKTRAEIKAIADTLNKYDRLVDREITVKEHQDKLRFAED